MAISRNGPEGGTATITKTEAVRQALLALGRNATRSQIQDFVLDQFGFEMGNDHVYTTKAIVLKTLELSDDEDELAEASREPAPQPEPARITEPVASSPPSGQQVSRLEAIRKTMAELGMDASRTDIQDYAMEHFGAELTPKYISDYRSKVFRRVRQKKGSRSRAVKKMPAKEAAPVPSLPAAKESVQPIPPQPAPVLPGNGHVVYQVEDILAVKALVGRLGADSLRTLVEAMTR
jgi:hypothetical protein